MARGAYTISAANQTVLNTAVTLLSLRPSATCSIEILRFWCSQAANATSAQQRIVLGTKVAAFGTLVGVTPAKTVTIDATSLIVSGTAEAAGTSGINASAEGAGVLTTIIADSFNVLNGWLWVPTPADTIILSAGSASAFNAQFPAAPATLSGWSWGCTFREI